MPLSGVWFVQRAARGAPASFGLAMTFGVLSVGTMANGVLALPLMAIQAALSGCSSRRCLVFATYAAAGTALYFHGYAVPGGHGSLGWTLRDAPADVLRFILQYLGGPFCHLAGPSRRGIAFGIAAGAVLVVALATFALGLVPPRRDAAPRAGRLPRVRRRLGRRARHVRCLASAL